MSGRISNLRRMLCGGSALATATVLSAGLAQAQFEETTETAAEQTPGETIVVTGSRIARDPNLASPIPVQSVTGTELREAGQPNITEVLNRLPALLSSTSSEASISGNNVLNLRGLGSNRTLTLVNGRRYVGGFEGSSAVDVASIPNALIDRVEVMTGGASALYGSDAVTGVINFILRDDFEGINVNARTGISSRGDAQTYNVELLAGHNFHNNRGNITLSVDWRQDDGLRAGDRPWSRDNGIHRAQANPALRFQQGDIGSSTPLFEQFYSLSAFRYPYGLLIPTTAQGFIDRYNAQFGTALTVSDLSAAELALIDRRNNSPTRAILPQPTFSISNRSGIISPFNLDIFHGIDLDGDGVPDCDQSFVGFNNQFYLPGFFGDPSPGSDGAFNFDYAGGCWTRDDNGVLRPYRDGLVAGSFNQFGGDGVPDRYDQDSLYPSSENITFNINTRYDITPNVRGFLELAYSKGRSRRNVIQNGFFDLMYGAPDNPFLPAELVGTSATAPGGFAGAITGLPGGLWITRDPTDTGGAQTNVDRETIRIVGGFEGEFQNGWSWEIAANYGQFTSETRGTEVILDRFFAAIDAVDGPGGSPVCRVDVDPTHIPFTTLFSIPEFNPGVFSFTPGSGQCRPANIWGGADSISQEARDFFTAQTLDVVELRQSVFSGLLVGDLGDFFTLPAGPVSFALGGEYRKENASTTRDPWLRGELPAESPFPAGTNISDVSDNNSLGFNALFLYQNSSGSYTAADAFVEVSVPLVADQPFFEELTFDAAYRVADYSTAVGTVGTWKLGLLWTPVDDISFRTSRSQAIRAPNLRETFITNPAVFRPVDPCDAAELGNAADPALREANCQAGGAGLPALPPGYTDPLSARFGGVLGGNELLTEETADTFTLGFVFTPRFLPGFSLTVDYWDIEIKDGIAAVSAQEIVDTCYDATDFPNNVFCTLFERETDAGSAQFGGFRFLNQTFVNFARIESRGYDFAASYNFSMWENDFGIRLIGSKQEALDFFTSRTDPTAVDPALREFRNPEWSAQLNLNWRRGPLSAGWTTLYQSDQAEVGVEIETIDNLFGPDGMAGESYTHNFNAAWQVRDNVRLYGGVNNVTDRNPFRTTASWPVGPRGRYFFLGVEASF
ncbi:TonB-dependent receptor domain-containing protein [Glycocaulis sp.]